MTPSESHVSKRTAYIYSKEYAEITSLLPSNIDRSKKVHALIEAYGLFKHPDLTIVSPRRATVKELCRYHSRDFIGKASKIHCLQLLCLFSGATLINQNCLQDFLQNVENNNSSDDDDDISDEGDRQKALEDRLEEYGLQYDCTVFEGIAQYAEFIAGSTIKAATLLNDDAFDVVIHWDGGRHHAKKDMSAGFCIVNDIVLGIMELQKVYNKIMYIDLDVHHGDGVENAFQFTDKVLTVSLHHFAEGFYPGTGSGVSASPRTKAVVNVPLRSGLSESNLLRIFDEMIEPLFKTYSADAVVLQCGVDGMTGDPLGKWNLSMNSYGECLKKIMAWKKPVMILGGGGYKTSSAARCYAYLTSLVLGSEISEEIPEHDYFEDYEPDFMLQLDVGRQTDENTAAYIEEVGRIVETQSKDL